MDEAIKAGLWGLLGGSALLLGALAGWFVPLQRRTIAGIMAFGAGVLISALSFELMDEAWTDGSRRAVVLGFLVGASIYTAANVAVAQWGARHRKRSDHGKRQDDGGPIALAIGALLDGIPESVVIGVSLLGGGNVSIVAVAAVFLSNIPEGLSSAAGMRVSGWSLARVMLLWGGIAAASGISALLGFVLLAGAPEWTIAAIQALAAGAILAMIIDTMAPEAFEGAHNFAGLIAVVGFLAAFVLSKAEPAPSPDQSDIARPVRA